MSEATGDKQPIELFPGVYDYDSLVTVSEDQLVPAEGSDWSDGGRLHTVGEETVRWFVVDSDAVLDDGEEQTICDLSGLFFVYRDRGTSKDIARTAVHGFSSLAVLLHKYRNKRSYPDLTDPIEVLNGSLKSLGLTSRIPTPPRKKRSPKNLMPAIETTALKLGEELNKQRLEQIKATGLFISNLLKRDLDPNHQDAGTWVSMDSFIGENVPVLLAPLAGLGIDMRELEEPPIIPVPDEEPESGNLKDLIIEKPSIQPVVFGKNGQLYIMPRNDERGHELQHVPYKRYGNYDDIFRNKFRR